MFTLAAVVLSAVVPDVSTSVTVAIVAFAIGALLAFLLVTPGRSASNRMARDRALRICQLEDQVQSLQDRNDQLLEQKSSVTAERSHLRGQLDALREHNVAAARATNTAGATNPDGYSAQQARDQDDRGERADEQTEQTAAERQAQADQQSQSQPQQESFGERIKGFFSGNNPDTTDAANDANDAQDANAPAPNATR